MNFPKIQESLGLLSSMFIWPSSFTADKGKYWKLYMTKGVGPADDGQPSSAHPILQWSGQVIFSILD